MSFDGREYSLANGQPVRLYQFARGALRWNYNSSDRDITYSGSVFKALVGGIGDNGILYSGDPRTDKFVITAPAGIEVAALFRGVPPSEEVALTVFDLHHGEAEGVTSWVGSISGVNWPEIDRCRITCVSVEASMEQPGLVDAYCRGCTAVLGDARCKVNMAAFRVDITPQSMNGSSVFSGDLDSYPDGWFTGGYVEWPIGASEYDRRQIEGHVADELVMLGGTAGMPSDARRVYPGCDFLINTCDIKFGNSDNFRGVPHLQGESPFDGNQVW
jgi:uncharacterized phage protein (TIGR02218 family)